MLTLLKKYKALVLLMLIFGLALFLRLYHLQTLPANFHEDEVLSGYIGRYILQNGRDIYGNRWPFLYFNKFGDYYIILPIYLSGLATYIFGINEFATRFPSAVFGALAVIPIFLLALWTFKNKKIALISALFSAITPWQLVLARSTTEGIIGSTLFLFGIICLIHSLRRQKIFFLLLADFLFLITYDIYHPFRLYVPLLLVPTLLIFKDYVKKRKYLFFYLGTAVFFLLLSAYIGTTVWGKARFSQTSIFSEGSGVSIKLKELAFSEGQQHILLARIFHNKVIGYGREFITQYLSYFSPVMLFMDGWKKSRYYVPEQGLFYLTFLVLLFISILPLPFKRPLSINKKNFIFLLFLLFLAPFPASFTAVESPNIHRALFLSYPVIILAAFGLYKSFFIQYKKISLSFFLVVFLALEIIYFWHQYSRHSDLYSSLIRNDPQKKVALYSAEKSKSYDEVILPVEGAMAWYYLFYTKDFSPDYIGKFRLDARIDQTKNIRYIENSCPTNALTKEDLKKRILVIDRFNCKSNDIFKQIDQISDVNPLMTYKVLVPR